MLLLTFLILVRYLLLGRGHSSETNPLYNGNGPSLSCLVSNLSSTNPQINDNDPILNNIKVGHIYGPSTANNDTREVINGNAINLINNKWFEFRKPTVIYAHGFDDHPSHIYTQSMAQAFLTRDGYNILFLDWSEITTPRLDDAYYSETAMSLTPKVAPHLAKLFIQWFNIGLCDKTFHLIGHSLGAELAGMVGYEVQRQSNGTHKLGRISGLDPVSPHFFPPIEDYRHVQSTDAAFVDIYHTNAAGVGAPIPIGVCDFWFNDPNAFQPGCDIAGDTEDQKIDCSHVRAIFLFAESVLAKSVYEFFYCIKANSWQAFMSGQVEYSDIAIAGMDTPDDTFGSYYCTTSNTSHYTHGLRGIGYNLSAVKVKIPLHHQCETHASVQFSANIERI